ncbi:hypothetical protein FSP39_017479, partial [Pinctada imbricata]
YPFLTSDCRKCEILFPKFMAASQPFQYDNEMAFGRISDDKLSKELDVSKFPSVILIHEGKKEPYRFEAKKFPAFYWYDNDEIPEKQRYGGHLDKLQIEEFIKDQTGLERKRDGELPPKVGIFIHI